MPKRKTKGNGRCQTQADKSTDLPVQDLQQLNEPQIIIDGVPYSVPIGDVTDSSLEALNERLGTGNYKQVEIWLGADLALPPQTIQYVARCCRATRDQCRFVGPDGSQSSPSAAIAKIAANAKLRVSAKVRDLAIELATAWHRDDVDAIRSELEELLSGSRVPIPSGKYQLEVRGDLFL